MYVQKLSISNIPPSVNPSASVSQASHKFYSQSSLQRLSSSRCSPARRPSHCPCRRPTRTTWSIPTSSGRLSRWINSDIDITHQASRNIISNAAHLDESIVVGSILLILDDAIFGVEGKGVGIEGVRVILVDVGERALQEEHLTSVWDVAEADGIVVIDGVVDVGLDVNMLGAAAVPARDNRYD